jgi:wobble nucleotide-excising tRNase
MLKKILKLQNVGLFHDGTPAQVDAAKVTLIYGENGRGKSSFAAVARSCSENRPDLILRRRTIDQTGDPTIEFIFDNGPISFKAGAWSKPRPEVLVFDDDFIEENAFTGKGITSANRRGLYTFALGHAVDLQKRMDAAAAKANEAGRVRGEKEKAVLSHSGQIPLKEFLALPTDPDAEKKLTELTKELEAANSSQKIQKRESLVRLAGLTVDLQGAFASFRKALPSIQLEAEGLVKAHIQKHPSSGFEDWISRGRAHTVGEECPYCAQTIQGIPLVAAYQSYFNVAYDQLKAEVAKLETTTIPAIVRSTAPWQGIIDANRNRAATWSEQIETAAPEFDSVAAVRETEALRELLLGITARKRTQPLDAVGSEEEEGQAVELLSRLNRMIHDYNEGVQKLNEVFDSKKAALGTVNQQELRKRIELQQARVRRHTPAVDALVAELQQAESDSKKFADEKEDERKAHDKAMEDTLSAYEKGINADLKKLRAGFTIVELKGQHAGGKEPRTTYAIQLRGKTVKALQRDEDLTGPCVPYALSEGDKRSLALAFFLARLKTDAQKQQRVLVFDDPVTSLDENRRKETVSELVELAEACAQVIVLSHDPYFLRQVRDSVGEKGIHKKEFKIGYAADDYSFFDHCDLGVVCESPYYRNYRLVNEYLAGVPQADLRAIAQALRLVVEGFYKRRYPGRVQPGWTFGAIIMTARKLEPGNPLGSLLPIADALDDFNEYASRYHHDSNPDGWQTEKILELDLRKYSRIAMDLIHADGRGIAP